MAYVPAWKVLPVKTRIVLVAVVASAMVAVPVASAVDGAPLPRRDGVVVAWQARSTTAIVITGDQRAYAIHTLRRIAPGSRVRVEGIKWGTPTSGIKWSVTPSGIKWGIQRAANGSYQSRLTRLTGGATTMSLRGTVVRRFDRRGVVVSVRGGTFVIPLRGAVWLPSGKRTNATTTLGQFGAAVTIRVSFDAKGRAFTRRVIETAPPSPTPTVPVSGRITAVDLAARTLTVQAGSTAFPVALTISVPSTVDLANYPVGSQIAATVMQAAAPDTTIAVRALSLNRTFAQADSPVTSIVIPAPNPLHVAAINDLKSRWLAGRAQGSVPNTGVFTSEQNRLSRVAFLINVGDKTKAISELEQFDKKLRNAAMDIITTTFRDEVMAAATVLRAQLLAG